MSLYYAYMFFLLSTCFFGLALSFTSSSSSFLVEASIMSVESVSITFPICVDLFSALFMSVVFFITGNVLYFSELYMKSDTRGLLFKKLVSFLVGLMSVVVLVPNILGMALGWDGLGIISYLLVIFYQTKKAESAGMLTALSNRVGDAFIIFSVVFSVELGMNGGAVPFDGCFWLVAMAFMAALTKSAQLPFSAWLPAAMEAPTPVSALVHSSTLVAAGVYLMLRFSDCALSASDSWAALMVVGSVTSMVAGVMAFFENDLKKIIALSTLSQLGLMVVTISLGLPKLAYFHMLTHAIFKSLLLICAGVIIHLAGHCQDIRMMGSMSRKLPVVSAATVISVMAMNAVPFTSGFFSKDAIVEATLYSSTCALSFLFCLISFALSWIYCFRLFTKVYLEKSSEVPLSHGSEPTKGPMIALSVGALVFGAALVGAVGPLSLEGFSPFNKFTVLVFPVFCYLSFCTLKKCSPKASSKSSKIYHGVCSMMLSSSILTQSIADSFNSGSSIVIKLDESWLEVGKGNLWKEKAKNIVNFSFILSLVAFLFWVLCFS